jgi:hypothetical protein
LARKFTLIFALCTNDSPLYTSSLQSVLLPTLATLNNLSFYPIILCSEIYEHLKRFVSSPDELVSVEAIRVMGNLSRRREIRGAIHQF